MEPFYYLKDQSLGCLLQYHWTADQIIIHVGNGYCAHMVARNTITGRGDVPYCTLRLSRQIVVNLITDIRKFVGMKTFPWPVVVYSHRGD